MISSKEKYSEPELVARAKKDIKHFDVLYNKYFEQIYLFVFKKVCNEDTAGEITSKTFLKAMMNLKSYEHRGFPFSSWLYRIAINEVNTFFRETKKIITVEVIETDIVAIIGELEEDNSEQLKQKLVSVLSKLKPEQTELIEMRFFDKMSFQEIAGIYNLSEPSVKMKLYRLLEKLKKMMAVILLLPFINHIKEALNLFS